MAAKPVKNPPKTPVKEPKPYKPPKETKEIAFERDILDDFREAWPDLAEIQARKLLHRGALDQSFSLGSLGSRSEHRTAQLL